MRDTRRKQISPSNLHISAFLVAKRRGTDEGDYSILFLRAGNTHPLSFRRGQLVLPSTMLNYGEKPREAVKRILTEQLEHPDSLGDLQFLGMQSYYGAHWDLVLLYGMLVKEEAQAITAKAPYTDAAFYSMKNLPRSEISEDHLEVLDEMLHPSEATS